MEALNRTHSISARETLAASVVSPTGLAVALTILAVALTTRLLTGSSNKTSNGATVPPMPPYWTPWLGHAAPMMLNSDKFLARILSYYPEGIFSLNLMGGVHSFVYKPAFVTSFLNKSSTIASVEWMQRRLMQTNFGFRKGDDAILDPIFKDIHGLYNMLNMDAVLGKMVDVTVRELNDHIADWVSFNSEPADQMQWEQCAEADVIDDGEGGTVVEANLMELTKNFIYRIATPTIFGSDFVNNFPDLAQKVWAFDENFLVLMSNLPAWVPFPPMQKARGARRDLLAALEEFHGAMEKEANGEHPGVRWENLDDVGQLLKDRLQIYREHKVELRIRAAIDLGVYWAMNANSNPLVFWMLYELCRDQVLLAQVREEIAPYVQVVQPKNEFGLAVWMAPKLENVNIDGLLNKCPLLKAAYIETLRLYTGGYALKYMEQDAVLGKKGDTEGSYLLKKGTYAHASHEMHQLDPMYFPDPMEWQATRHLKETVDEQGNKTTTVDMGTIRPYGGGFHMCKGRAYAARELMLFTATLISMYDIGPPGGQKWENLKTFKATATKHPVKPVKAWIRRREVPQEK